LDDSSSSCDDSLLRFGAHDERRPCLRAPGFSVQYC